MKMMASLAPLIAGVVVIGVCSTAMGAPPDPRPGPSTPVTVVNTPDQPVPVVGDVEIVNTSPVPVVGDVEIVNTSPIAVTVVPPAASEQVICTVLEGSSGPGNWPVEIGSSTLTCPAGVTAVDIQRVIFDPSALDPSNATFSSRDYLIYNMLVGIGPAGNFGLAKMTTIFGMFTQSELDKTLPRPVRITLATQWIYFQGRCGAPGVTNTICGSGAIIIGTPIR